MENRPENHLPITDGETDFAKSWFSESARLTEERMRACETAKAESEGRSPAFPEVRLRSVCRNTNAVFVEVEKRTFFMFGENYGKLYQSIFSTYVVQRRLENPGDEKRE